MRQQCGVWEAQWDGTECAPWEEALSNAGWCRTVPLPAARPEPAAPKDASTIHQTARPHAPSPRSACPLQPLMAGPAPAPSHRTLFKSLLPSLCMHTAAFHGPTLAHRSPHPTCNPPEPSTTHLLRRPSVRLPRQAA